MNSKILMLSVIIMIALSLNLIQIVESKPIDLLEELMSDKFLMRMFGYMMDGGSERRDDSGVSAGDRCMLPPRKGNCRALLRRYR